MAEQMMVLEAVVGMDATAFRRGMANVRNDVGILSSTIGGISGAARTMTLAFTAPMVALGTLAVNAASGFDASMRNINSILQLNEDQFASLSAQALDFAKTTRDGVIPATDALYEIFSAGILDQGKAMEIWKVSTKVAEAGVADLSQTTNAITATMNAFNLSQDQSTRVGNIWTRMVQVGVGSLGDFLSNAQKILPLSNLLGVSLEDMGASVAFLSQGGGGAAKAETSFAQVMSNLLKPTNAMTDAFAKLGVATGKELVEKFGTVQNAIQQLKNVTPDDTLFNKMFAKTGLEAAGMFVTNADKFKQSVTDFNKGLDTATMDAWTQQSKSFAFQLDLMKTALQGVATVIGQAILPLITPVINGITQLFTSISDTNPELIQMGVAFVGIVAAAAPVIWLITSMINPIGLVVGAIGALVTAFAADFGGIRTKLTEDIDGIIGTLMPLKDGIQTFLDSLFPKSGGTDGEDKLAEVLGFEHTSGDMMGILIGNALGNAPTNLWEIYSDQGGYMDEFSWDEFKKMAVDAGWDGKAIKPGDMLNLLTPNTKASSQEQNHFLSALMGLTDQFDVEQVTKNVGTSTSRQDNSIGAKLAKAFDAAWPVIKPALENIWANVQNWFTGTFIPGFDTFGSDILNAISRSFLSVGSTGAGDGQLYDALKGTINGGAAKTGEQISSDFQKNFPGIATALSNLFTSISGWIQNEGLPTIGRSIGMLAGKVAVMLGTALGSIWAGITSGATGKANGDAQNFVQDSFLTPVNEGFQEELTASGVTNPIDSFFTNLSAVLVAAAIAWKIAPEFATNIISTIATTLSAKLGISTAFTAVGTAVKTGIGAAISQSMAGGMLGQAWLNLAIFKEGIVTAITGALGGITLGGVALALGAVTATVGALIMIFSPEARKAVNDAVGGLIDGAFGEGSYDTINKKFEGAAYKAAAAITLAKAAITIDPTQKAELERQAAVLLQWGDETPVNVEVPVNITAGLMNMIPTAGDASGLDPNLLNPFNVANWNIDTNVSPMPILQPAIDAINQTVIDPTAFTEFTTNLDGTLQTAIATGNFDGQNIVDTLLVPLATGFTANFGAESPASIAWTSFIAGITTGSGDVDTAFILISQDIALLLADVLKNMPLIAGAVAAGLNPIIKSLSDANFIAKTLASTLSSLDGATVTLTTSVVGGTPVDGSHAMGLDRVPFDNYLAQLHKGERVLTATEAKDYNNAAAPAMANQGGGNTNNQYNISITGVNDIDAFLREARRRGIPIGRQR